VSDAAVWVTLQLLLSFDDIADDLDNWKLVFRQEVAQTMGVDISRLHVKQVSPGSVMVELAVLPDAMGTDAGQLVDDLKHHLADSPLTGSILSAVGDVLSQCEDGRYAKSCGEEIMYGSAGQGSGLGAGVIAGICVAGVLVCAGAAFFVFRSKPSSNKVAPTLDDIS
jgi:hypothetical protein